MTSLQIPHPASTTFPEQILAHFASGLQQKDIPDHVLDRAEEPRRGPGNTLSRQELEQKANSLALYGGGATAEEMQSVFGLIWSLRAVTSIPSLLHA